MHWHWTPPEQIVNGLPAIVLAGLCLLIGAVFIFWGWKIFRVALALMGALVGWAVGLAIAAPLGLGAVFVALPLAIICALLALFLVRVGVFLIAGLWAALLVLGATDLIQAAAARYVAAGVAFFVIGVLARAALAAGDHLPPGDVRRGAGRQCRGDDGGPLQARRRGPMGNGASVAHVPGDHHRGGHRPVSSGRGEHPGHSG